jgi:hypothetical protein
MISERDLSRFPIDLAWPSRFPFEALVEYPNGNFRHLCFDAGPSARGHGDVLIRAGGSSGWIGQFRRGSGDLDRGLSTPSPDHVCVIAGGIAYWVDVSRPTQYTVLPPFPVQDVRAAPERDIMIFVDFTRIYAYGNRGHLWTSPRISSDGIKIGHVDADQVDGVAWDAAIEREVAFSVDLETGELSGGAAPT